jgi:hypothetical protein
MGHTALPWRSSTNKWEVSIREYKSKLYWSDLHDIRLLLMWGGSCFGQVHWLSAKTEWQQDKRVRDTCWEGTLTPLPLWCSTMTPRNAHPPVLTPYDDPKTAHPSLCDGCSTMTQYCHCFNLTLLTHFQELRRNDYNRSSSISDLSVLQFCKLH